MMPGRPVFLLLPLLAVPIAWLYAQLEPNSPARAGAQALLLVSLAVTLALVVIDPRVPALQEGDGSSALLLVDVAHVATCGVRPRRTWPACRGRLRFACCYG